MAPRREELRRAVSWPLADLASTGGAWGLVTKRATMVAGSTAASTGILGTSWFALRMTVAASAVAGAVDPAAGWGHVHDRFADAPHPVAG